MRAQLRLIIVLLGFLSVSIGVTAQSLSEKEKKRREINARFDKLELREKREFVVDTSDRFLQPPEKKITGDFVVAKTAPTVKLQVFPNLEPEYFSGEDQYMACWANWAYVARSDDNRFYMSASDHLAKGCDINVYEYDPADDSFKRIIDVDELLGWTDDMYTDGKIHGEMGVMPDGTLWAATHYGVRPEDEWYENGYQGSWLFSYNVNTGEGKNWGVPLPGNSLPCFKVDTRRGFLVGTGYKNTALSWDCNEKKVRFADYPPNDWILWRRSLLLDEETGKFWSMDFSREPYGFISFDPAANRFERYDVTVPPNPHSGEIGKLRGHTDGRAMDGWFYWATWNGALFKFKPDGADGPLVEPAGVTWGKGRDTLQMGLSPKGRYIYYRPRRSPALVQYDVKTGRKKALCFLQGYYFEKYGYWMGDHVYGLNVSDDGSFVVMVMNGTFAGRDKSFGHPAICVVEIPESEREE